MSRSGARDLGDFPTPGPLADVLARECLGAALRGGDVPSVLDPACGEGALLIAAGALMRRRGVPTDGRGLLGVEVHPGRAAGARRALRHHGLERARIVRGDALVRPSPLRDGVVDAVIANPPFLSPTASRGAIAPSLRRDLRARHADALGPLTNVAALFLAEAMQLVRPGGTVGMILPGSFLTSRDAAPVRAAVLRSGTVEWLWTGGTDVFDAAVTVCGVVVRRDGRRRRRVRHATGPTARPAGTVAFDAHPEPAGAAWRPAPGAGDSAPFGRVRDMSTPIAGFRRHYYAVASALQDDPDGAGRPVVTAGLIDPGRVLWGRHAARIAKRDWGHPRVDAAHLDDAEGVTAWLRATRVPKVLVATQTRVIECAVDTTGDAVAGVPVIALPAAGDAAWRLAAALSSPHLSRLAFDRHAGAAMSPDAIKMSGAELGALPLPRPGAAWQRGARAMQAASVAADEVTWRGALQQMAEAMADAYELPPADDPREWWLARLPPFRGAVATR